MGWLNCVLSTSNRLETAKAYQSPKRLRIWRQTYLLHCHRAIFHRKLMYDKVLCVVVQTSHTHEEVYVALRSQVMHVPAKAEFVSRCNVTCLVHTPLAVCVSLGACLQ